MMSGKKTDKRRQLEVIADEDEGLGKAERAKADRKRNLARLVDDAVIELAAREEGAENGMKRQSRRAQHRVQAGASSTYWSIERAVVATTWGRIRRSSNCSMLAAGPRAPSVY